MVKIKGKHIKAYGTDEELFEDVALMSLFLSDTFDIPIIDVCATLVQKAEDIANGSELKTKRQKV